MTLSAALTLLTLLCVAVTSASPGKLIAGGGSTLEFFCFSRHAAVSGMLGNAFSLILHCKTSVYPRIFCGEFFVF